MDEETAEQEARQLILHEASLERHDIITAFVGHYAATAIQKRIRGYITRKRVKVKRKRLQFTALLLQRITRAGLARMTIRLLRLLPERNPPRLRMLMRYRYNHKGKLGRNPTLRVAAVTILQRLCRRVPSILRVQHQRDRYAFVMRCVVLLQAATRRMLARKRYGSVLQECKRSRHEALLKAYVEQQVAVRLLSRVEHKQRDNERERLVCRQMQQGRSYQESVAIVEARYPVKGLSSSSRALAAVQASRSINALREVSHSHFCNHRHILGLNEPDSDTEDDSIDEELLQPPSLHSRRRRAAGKPNPSHSTKKGGKDGKDDLELTAAGGSGGSDREDERPFGWSPTKQSQSLTNNNSKKTASRKRRQGGFVQRRGPQQPSPFDVVSRLAYGW